MSDTGDVSEARELVMETRRDLFAEEGSAEIDGFDAARSFADAVAARAAEDFTVTMDGGAMTTTYHGREGFLAGWSDFVEPFETIRIEPEEMIDSPDPACVVEFVRLRSRPRGTPAEIVQEAAAVWRTRGSRIVAVEFHMSRDAALRSGGVERRA